MHASLEHPIRSIPPGAWAIGVSGGADSVALLCLARERADVQLHLVHLNHETRADESDGDMRFVAQLAAQLNIPSTIARRSELESRFPKLPPNPSDRYRQLRHHLFASVVREHGLRGVLLAHHADDQAETVLQRLLRGSGWPGLCGMSAETQIGGICYFRPLLNVRSNELRHLLESRQQKWREDASNASEEYQRNRIRKLLQQHTELSSTLIELSESARTMRDWTARNAPVLSETFSANNVSELPRVLRHWAIAEWLRRRGISGNALSPAVIDRVADMAIDAATPSHVTLPGGIMLHRKRGTISVNPAASQPARRPAFDASRSP